MERNASKQSSLISEILGMYKILGNTSETVRIFLNNNKKFCFID